MRKPKKSRRKLSRKVFWSHWSRGRSGKERTRTDRRPTGLLARSLAPEKGFIGRKNHSTQRQKRLNIPNRKEGRNLRGLPSCLKLGRGKCCVLCYKKHIGDGWGIRSKTRPRASWSASGRPNHMTPAPFLSLSIKHLQSVSVRVLLAANPLAN